MTTRKKVTTIDTYIKSFPKETQRVLQQLRRIIKVAAPEAEEEMSYGIPTFALRGNLVHFAAFKQHIGFYPTPSAITAFAKELRPYKQAKGSVQFPLDKAIPYSLVKKMVQFRVKENMKKETS
ncbi:MAG: DUF1801 domain-containing protein [Candidatus Andersenbacteria bacterium]